MDSSGNGDVCRIPKINPFDEKALKLIHAQDKNAKPPGCLKNPSKFKTDLRTNLIRINASSEFWNSVKCCYYPFTAHNIFPSNLKL